MPTPTAKPRSSAPASTQIKGFIDKFDPAIGSGGLEADFEQLWESVRQIRCPTLLVRGSESPILAAETERLQAASSLLFAGRAES